MPPPSIRLLHQLVLLAPLALGGASTASDRRRKSWDDGAGRANAAAAPGSRAQLSEGVGGSSGASVPTAPLGAALPRRTPESVRPFEDRAAAGSGGAQAWKRILPAGACATAADCSLNGECIGGSCACTASWTGHNCQHLALQPLPAEYGYGRLPNITSWGGSIFKNWSDPTSLFHLYVSEATNGTGLASWVTNSQIVHAVSSTATGPYSRRQVVLQNDGTAKTSNSNPQVLYDESSSTFLLFHILAQGNFQLLIANSTEGPWHPHEFGLGGCNNPTAAFHPTNGSLYVLCHDAQFSLYGFHPVAGKYAWQVKPAAPIPTLQNNCNVNKCDRRDVEGNCEDPFLFFDRHSRFHVVAHCYTCYWYPATKRPTGAGVLGRTASDGCTNGTAFCSGHGFSATGERGDWTYVGGPDAPYSFTSTTSAGGILEFSTRERPWGLLGGQHGDDWIVLVNGVSQATPLIGGTGPLHLKYLKGRDYTFTNIQPVQNEADDVVARGRASPLKAEADSPDHDENPHA